MELSNAQALKNWLKQGDHDLSMAKNIVEDGGYDTCAFLCQQALEKYLKAYYIQKINKNPPKTHYLDELAKGLSCPDEILETAKELSADYMISRYPDAATAAPCDEYTETDAKNKIAITEKALDWIKGRMKR